MTPPPRRQGTRDITAPQPDVAIVDAQLSTETGIEFCRQIAATDANIRTLVPATHHDNQTLSSASAAGASGYVLKRLRGTDLTDAFHLVASQRSSTRPGLPGQPRKIRPTTVRLPSDRTAIPHPHPAVGQLPFGDPAEPSYGDETLTRKASCPRDLYM